MIAFGSSETDLFRFAPDSAEQGYLVQHVQMVRVPGQKNEVWEPVVKAQYHENVHLIGQILVGFTSPQGMVDFATVRESAKNPVKTVTVKPGPCLLDLLHVRLPLEVGEQFRDLAVLPKTTIGMMLSGLIRSRLDHGRYWLRRAEQERLLRVLNNRADYLRVIK